MMSVVLPEVGKSRPSQGSVTVSLSNVISDGLTRRRAEQSKTKKPRMGNGYNNPTMMHTSLVLFCCCCCFLLLCEHRCLAFLPYNGDSRGFCCCHTSGRERGGPAATTRTRRASLVVKWDVRRHRRRGQAIALSSDAATTKDGAINEESSSASSTTGTTQKKQPRTAYEPICLYRNSATDNWWRERVELKDLTIGQELQGVMVQRHLEGTTGPKVYVDCGVGRRSSRSDDDGDGGGQQQLQWHIVHGMLRLPKEHKFSVTQKRAARLAKKASIPVYVTRIFVASGRLEVSLTPPALSDHDNAQRPMSLQSTASLQPGDEIIGVPTAFRDYGILMKLLPNYNRHGLLHISKVAEACGLYVKQAAGLRRFASNFNDVDDGNIPLVVLANNKRRGIELDLSPALKQALIEERESLRASQKNATADRRTGTGSSAEAASSDDTSPTTTVEATISKSSTNTKPTTTTTSTRASIDISAYAEYYAEYGNQGGSANINVDREQEDEGEEYDDDEDDDDRYAAYDELDDIEDALGLGTY